MMRYTYQHNGQTYSLHLEEETSGRFSISMGERTFEVEAQPVPGGGWRLLWDGQAFIIYSAANGDQRYVQVDDQSYSLSVTNASVRRKTSTSRDALSAQMPGQVTAVLAQVGDTVTRGQILLMLEAMKMEIRVNAPSAGRVQKFLVKIGDVVQRGQQLVEMAFDSE